MNSTTMMQAEKEHVLQNYDRFPVVIETGNGVKLIDADGKSYIDMTSGIGVNALGYNNDIIKNAVKNQLDKVMHTSNVFYNSECIELAKLLTGLTGMSKVFFCNSGAEANEGAIKIARKYGFVKYEGKRNKIITMVNSFHGRTITTLAATGQEKYHNYFFPFTEGFSHVALNNVSELSAALDDTVCAVMMEFVQGEGGILPMDVAYAKQVEQLCKEKDVLLIMDEIQCGIGRTGYLFAYEAAGIKPDIVTSAKALGGGLPIGAVLVNEKLENILQKGDHGSTFGGNAVAAAAARAVIQTISQKDFLLDVANKGSYIKNKLNEMHSDKIVETRGCGLMLGVELTIEAKAVISSCIDKGVLFLSAGKNVVRMLPPLTISYEQIDAAMNVLQQALLEA